MTDVHELAKIMNEKGWSFYHFTDDRNLPSIRAHGLLSMREIRQRALIVAPGGNNWSLEADQRSGMDAYVHLGFFSDHPMEYVAKKEGRIVKTRYLKIRPDIITLPGVLISDRVANRADALPKPAEEMIDKLDLDVIYTRTDWTDAKIKVRLKAAQLCEILIPKSISVASIKNLG
jgi:hypothetical protein